MKKLLLILSLLYIGQCKAQDSLQNVISKFTFETPRLSPRPQLVSGVVKSSISLNGFWKFNTIENNPTNAKNIKVPGEWAMQGFTVKKGTDAYYFKSFTIPSDWIGKRIKIRFDGVSSHGEVRVNGKIVGDHEGSFAPFEFDITSAIKAGQNMLEVVVQCGTISDILACTSQYAAHPVGGILRKVTLFALPTLNIADFFYTVKFDANFTNAQLLLNSNLAAETAINGKVTLVYALKDASGKVVPLKNNLINFEVSANQKTISANYGITVISPKKWNSEQPHLYTLITTLKLNGKVLQVNQQKIGFRQIDHRGNQLFVNNNPVKLRGVNRHETHPLLGRSLTPELCRRDVVLFKNGNCNYIRTSHYPPSEEFLEACDELGMFVESESSLCWIQHNASPIWEKWNYLDTKYLPYMVRANMDNVLAGRQHPSVIIWSLGNESRWSPLWERVNKEVKKLEPSRPTSFHDQCWGGYNNAGSKADLANYHYPGFNGPAECEKDKTRPTLFGEYMHVQTYSRREVETDPSVRSDAWANTLKKMVDSVYYYPACLGGAIWSGIDDIFHYSKDSVNGYGPWGIIDGWRREKPEFTGMRKAYAPVIVSKITAPHDLVKQKPITLSIENRYNFLNIADLTVSVKVGNKIKPFHINIAPLSKGTITIDTNGALPTDKLVLTFKDPDGRICQEEEFALTDTETTLQSVPSSPVKVKLSYATTASHYLINMDQVNFKINRNSGMIEEINSAKVFIASKGGLMMLIDHNEDDGGAPDIAGNNYTQNIKPFDYKPLENWKSSNVKLSNLSNGDILIHIEGVYEGKLEGFQDYLFQANGEVTIRYDYTTLTDFTYKTNRLLRQGGILFSLPSSYDLLSWERKGLWTTYPSWDPNRLKGTAKANARNLKYVVTPLEIPGNLWKDNSNKLGSNDFKGTKEHILFASLKNNSDHEFRVSSDYSQSARAWVDGDHIDFLISGFTAPGSCYFFTGPRPEFKKGTHLTGSFKIAVH
jgi:hypothetical protein